MSGSLYIHRGQAEVLRDQRRFKVVVAGRRWGKALALNTPVPTPRGWTTMGELQDGDLVFDETGKPCRVVKAHAVMHDRPCYEVVFSDGETIVADGEHLWSTWTHAARKNMRRNPGGDYGPEVRTTEQIAATLTHGKRGDNNHSIPCAGAVQYDAKELPIDPYLLGAWLGDGDSRCAAMSVGEQDLEHFSAVVREALGGNPTATQDPRTGVWRLPLTKGRGCAHDVHKNLRRLDLFTNKHVPRAYLEGSIEQRLALLQGLMDTDGTCNAHAGNCEFTSVRRELVEGVLELALSLGIKATLIEGRSSLNGRDCGAKWRVKFSTNLPVFRLARKLDRMPKTRRFRIDHRFIVAVRPVPSVPVRCITVDSPNRLYLCSKSFIPTHNTQTAKTSLLKAASVKNRVVWYVAPTYRMARSIMWRELLRAIPRNWIVAKNETMMTLLLRNNTLLECKGADKPDTLRGVELHHLVIDECQDIRKNTWYEVLRPTLLSTRGTAMFIGTPKGFNWFYDLFQLGQRGEIYRDKDGKRRRNSWMSWQFTTEMSPFIPPDEIASAREDLDARTFRQEFQACHLPETLILLADGTKKPICKMQKGDHVVHVTDEGKREIAQVLQIGETGIKPIADVVLETGEIISASDHHKFKVYDDR